jgi:hypothetical protein
MEYNFLYELLNAVAVEWSDAQQSLGDMLGKTDYDHKWHLPEIDDIEAIMEKFNGDIFPDGFEYRETNFDERYFNFFGSRYDADPFPDSLSKYFQYDTLKWEFIYLNRNFDMYMAILKKHKIEKYYDGKRMAWVHTEAV